MIPSNKNVNFMFILNKIFMYGKAILLCCFLVDMNKCNRDANGVIRAVCWITDVKVPLGGSCFKKGCFRKKKASQTSNHLNNYMMF